MALSKCSVNQLSCFFRSINTFPRRYLTGLNLLLQEKGVRKNFKECKTVRESKFGIDGKHFQRNVLLYRNFSEAFKPPNNSIEMPQIITKDRLILLGLGILFVGCMVGLESHLRDKRQDEKLTREFHRIVLEAQNCVKDEKYEDAAKLYQAAHDLVEEGKIPLSRSKVFANIVDQASDLGHLAFVIGNYTEAEQLLSRAEHIMLQCGVSKDDDMYIEVILRLGKLDTMNGRRESALERFEFCMEKLEKKISVVDIYAEECSDRITLYGLVLTEYGTYTRELGMLDESEKAFSKALNICRNVMGPTHEQTSVLANDLATVYDEKGRYNKAIRLAEKAIKIATESSPENLATYKYNLGHILMHKGDFKRAKKALREALQLAEENQDEETKQLIESSMMKLDIPSS